MKKTIEYRNGNQLSYADYGDPSGDPILIQHGLIASIKDVALFDRLIQMGFRLICIARPGYGDSSPYLLDSFAEWGDIVLLVVNDLALNQFDVLGISSGAPYAYSIGCRLSESVRNIFILSGIPALYDEIVSSHWPYPAIETQDMAEIEQLAHELFFSNLSQADLNRDDIHDAMMHNGFGVAQDLRLRFIRWGFSLSDIRRPVFMRHSKGDGSVPFRAAVRTAELLPNCILELTESGPHFSDEVLNDFIENTIGRLTDKRIIPDGI